MDYVLGLTMEEIEMAMGLAAAGPPPPNPPNSNYNNIPTSRPIIGYGVANDEGEDEYDDEDEDDEEEEKPVATTSKRKKSTKKKEPAADPAENYTDIVPGQGSWSFENLPDILYVFRGPNQPRGNVEVPTKPSAWGDSPSLRCFPILPDRVSGSVEEFRVEAWMRMDRRIQLHDITDRMHPAFRIVPNTLQQRGVRFRQAFNIASWGVSSKQTDKAVEAIKSKLIQNNISLQANTTRGLTPGLINPSLGEAGGRISVPRQYARRKDTTIRVGMAAGNSMLGSIGPAPALVPRMYAPTSAINPGANSTQMISKSPPAAVASFTGAPSSVTASTSLRGLRRPAPTPTRVMPAQILARAATNAIANPYGHCFTAPVLTASGEVRSVRAPTLDAANATLESAIANILQEQTRNPLFEELLNDRQSQLMRDYERRMASRPPQTVQANPDTWPCHQPMVSWAAEAAPNPTPAPRPTGTISNPEHNLLRRVQDTPIQGSARPKIKKASTRRQRLSPARNHGHRQNGRNPTASINTSRELDRLEPSTIRAIISLLEVNTEEQFRQFCHQFTASSNAIVKKSESPDPQPQALAASFNEPQVGTTRPVVIEFDNTEQAEEDLVEDNLTFDELIAIYEHEQENGPARPIPSASDEYQEVANTQEYLMEEAQRVADIPSYEYLGITQEQYEKIIAGDDDLAERLTGYH
ncbi:uncharacterized protein GIQ15_05161 [Arthroderma uncinatum]|uniref:uncharacterized protein n=1 Tax=Arthroderma uncinatum TaxID=74035 RepID=UPI00144A6DE6|nr:uncharacterized protein GIQ15_05161 [Arthroderma uncinatum]KAF3482402.1 hypothetical protein GIQ15_05161 [Arthroderma uncinatum]